MNWLLTILVLWFGQIAIADPAWTDAQWKSFLRQFKDDPVSARETARDAAEQTKIPAFFIKAIPQLLETGGSRAARAIEILMAAHPNSFLPLAPTLLASNAGTTRQGAITVLEGISEKQTLPTPVLEAFVRSALEHPLSRDEVTLGTMLFAQHNEKAPLADSLWREVAKAAASPDPTLKELALRIISRGLSLSADRHEVVSKLLEDPNRDVQRLAAGNLSRIHPFSEETWKRLPALTNHPDNGIRKDAVREVEKEQGGEAKLEKAGGEIYSLSKYVRDCENDGMEIPESINCMEGEEVPIYKTICEGDKKEKVRLTPENYEQYRPKEGGHPTCDNPSHLMVTNPGFGGACVPGSRIQMIKGKAKDSLCTVMCRKYRLSTEKMFQDINMICHNPKNGKTCYFNTPIQNDIDGSLLHKPGSKEDAKWLPIEHYGNRTLECYICHDNDPFIVTPHLKNTQAIADMKALRSPFAPYSASGSMQPLTSPDWKERHYLNDPGVKSCTTCHRLGEHATCSWLSKQLAADLPPGKRDPNDNCVPDTFPDMPMHQGKLSPTEMADLRVTLARMEECCNAGPRSGKCKWTEDSAAPAQFDDESGSSGEVKKTGASHQDNVIRR